MNKAYINEHKQSFETAHIEGNASYAIWLICAFFVFLQFFLQLSSGIVIGTIMYEMQLSALTASILSCSFYIVYTILQIPVGILADKYNSRILLTLSSITCGIGCLFFALSHIFITLFLARILIGIGSSFAFVIMVHMVRTNYPIKYFSTLIGISETLGFIATAAGIIGMGKFIGFIGWRGFMQISSVFAVLLSLTFWLKIPNTQKPHTKNISNLKILKQISTNKLLWINGVFVGLSFATITVFGALWAAPFIEAKLQCNIINVSILNSLLFIGAGIGCPLFGQLSVVFIKRKPIIIGSSIISGLLFFLLIYIPTKSLVINGVIIFLLGVSCCAYILAYAISNELSPPNSLSTCAGFTNTLALCTAPLLQPLIGYVLDSLTYNKLYTFESYQHALSILPVGLLISGYLVSLLPEKTTKTS